MVFSFLVFLLSLLLLIYGARLLVFGASELSLLFGISPLVVGLTVVAIGTSSPEIGVSVLAAIRGKPELVLGNVIGSNIFNILLVLGLCSLISPLKGQKSLIWTEVPLMIFLSIILWIIAAFKIITWWEGTLLLCGLVLYFFYMGKKAQKEREKPSRQRRKKSPWVLCITLLAGLLLLAIGADQLVDSAIKIARGFEISELFIGLTIVAAGTSLPEAFASLTATFKGEGDLVIGNIIGSNIINILAVLGFSALFSFHGLPVSPQALHFDLPVMTGVAMATFPIFLTQHKIDRWEGIIFLIYYIAYMTSLFLQLTNNTYYPLFKWSLFGFLLPLTLLTLMIGLYRHFLRRTP
ncbi:MAG: calcium/sodium antiporter [Chlamydiia bacterium]|nr:calcium/sodium antiporter [Chlamydiia bacterium]